MLPLIQLPPTEHGDRIAIFGPMCSGKTYVADHLVQNFNYFKLGFATKLKAVAKDLFDIEGKNQEARELLQGFADDCKKWDSDLFTKHFLIEAEKHRQIVCDDMRFAREAEVLRENGFVLVQVECGEARRLERINKLYNYSSTSVHNHNSEQDYKNIEPDLIIQSNIPDDIRQIYKIWKKV